MSNEVELVKSKLDIVEVVSKYVDLKPSGDRKVGFCPLHANVNTPSFTVYPKQQSWWCYGCQQGGDVLEFLGKIEDEDFGTLMKRLKEELGIATRRLSREERRKLERQKKYYSLLDDAVGLYSTFLLWRDEAKYARTYLESRGITADTIAEYQLGYAPNTWEFASKGLAELGHAEEDIIKLGLARNRTGKTYDYFRDRVMFPIRNNGQVISFAGRVLHPTENVPKYLNGPNSLVFKKREILYGFPQALSSIKEERTTVLVEGYMDVLALHQRGFRNTVGLMGLALSPEHAAILVKYAPRAILALDPDEAAEVALARLHIERLSGLDLYVATLPAGRDPDEIVLESPAEWEDILYSAKPLPVYMTDYLIDKNPTGDIKTRRDIAQTIIRLIDIVDDPVEQAAYQEYLADSLGFTNYRPNPRCPHCGKKHYGD